MKHRPPNSRPCARVSCEEFDEVSATRAEEGDQAIACELFAHALLESDAAWREGGTAGQEQRVQRVLRALDAERAPAPISLAAARVRRAAWVAAAAIFLGLLVTFWPDRSMTPAYAEQLFDRALAAAAESTHVYDIEMRFRKGERRPTMKVELALASGNRFHAKVRSGGGLIADGVEFGSNGTVLWARSRSRGEQAFELAMHDPDSQSWGRLGPGLPYYELRPFLEAQYGDLELTVREKADGRVVLGGAYENESKRSVPAWDEANRTWKRVTRSVRSRGVLRVEIEEATGQLMRIERNVETENSESVGDKKARRLRHYKLPRLDRFEIRRKAASIDPGSRGFDFDPPRKRSNPFWLHSSQWKRLGRALWKKLESKREPGAAPVESGAESGVENRDSRDGK